MLRKVRSAEGILARRRGDGAPHPLARCGYQDYAAVEAVFALARPKRGGDGVS